MAEGRVAQVWSQERIVLALAVLLFVAAALGLPGFLAVNNLIAIVRSVSVLGILAVGMAIVIIGRGIDLSAVAIMAMSVAWYLQMLNDGTPEQRGAVAGTGAACCSSAWSTASSSPMPMCRRSSPRWRAAPSSSASCAPSSSARMRSPCRRGTGSKPWAGALPRHSRRGLPLRGHRLRWPSCSCASPNGAAMSI